MTAYEVRVSCCLGNIFRLLKRSRYWEEEIEGIKQRTNMKKSIMKPIVRTFIWCRANWCLPLHKYNVELQCYFCFPKIPLLLKPLSIIVSPDMHCLGI